MKIDPWRAARRFLDGERGREESAPIFGPALHVLKMQRMSASSFAFLRGSAGFFYDVVAKNPSLLGTRADEGWIVGDLHLENFGAFRTGKGDDVVFDVNDFDDAARGPRRLDLLRLTTSVLLAASIFGFRGLNALALAEKLLDGYAGAGPKKPPPPVTRLLARVKKRSRHELLARRTEVQGGKRRLVRGARYVELPKRWRRLAREAFHAYVLDSGQSPTAKELEVCDVAFRIAGTGSLGALRFAILTAGKGGKDGNWLFDLKEERRSACALALGETTKRRHVVEAMARCLERRPIALGRSRVEGVPLVGRRLAPQEDKLALATLLPDELALVLPWLGVVVARLHARSGAAPRLSLRERSALLDDAVVLAGLHEGSHLALCRMLGRTAPATR